MANVSNKFVCTCIYTSPRHLLSIRVGAGIFANPGSGSGPLDFGTSGLESGPRHQINAGGSSINIYNKYAPKIYQQIYSLFVYIYIHAIYNIKLICLSVAVICWANNITR